jgi:DNA topoisomerase VI subunit B
MYIAIQHKITDSEKWQEAVQTFIPKIPQNIKPHSYLPSTDVSRANCLWEGDSVASVKAFVEKEFGHCSRNEYYEVDSKGALGLP